MSEQVGVCDPWQVIYGAVVVRWTLKYQILLQFLPVMARRAGTPQPRAQRHFFHSNFDCFWSHLPSQSSLKESRWLLPVAASSVPSRGNRDKNPPGTAAKQRKSRSTSLLLAGSTSKAKGIASGDGKCLLSFLWGPEFANVIVFPEI